MGAVEDIERVVAPVVAAVGLELVDVEVRPGNLKVTVDRDGGADLESIGTATSAISRALDAEDVVPGGHYELEVSSPGVERRLRRPEHFVTHLGAEVAVRTRPGTEGERRFSGVLQGADESGILVATEAGARRVGYSDLERVHTIFDWRAALAGCPAPSARSQRRAGRRATAPGAGRPARPEPPARADREMTETR